MNPIWAALVLFFIYEGGLAATEPAVGETYTPDCPTPAKHFLNISQLSNTGIKSLVHLAGKIKRKTKDRKISFVPFENMQLGLIFTKPSLRTRASFEAGFQRLGGGVSFFSNQDIALGKREAVKDVARVAGRFYDVIASRVHAHDVLEQLACHSPVPIVNALSNYNHPLQIMSDLLTITEVLKTGPALLKGKKVVYIGDCNNMVTSWLLLATRIPFTFGIACPEQLAKPDENAMKMAKAAGLSTIIYANKPQDVLEDADVVYADVWTSMGFKEEEEKRLEYFDGWTITTKMLKKTGKNETIFMHCLPAERGREVSDKVMESSQSVVFHQAENRQHMQMAILYELLKAKTDIWYHPAPAPVEASAAAEAPAAAAETKKEE